MWLLLTTSLALAAPVLRSADVDITLTSPTSCAVTMTLRVEGASEIDHRVDRHSSAAGGVELVAVEGARQVGAVSAIGRTQSLVLRPDAAGYRIRYRAEVPAEQASRCPLWLPVIPTDGLSRAVTITVDLPAGATPADSMPRFSWTGTHGEVTLGHLPAFVRVSYGASGTPTSWGISSVMDALTVVVIVVASAIWVWLRRRDRVAMNTPVKEP